MLAVALRLLATEGETVNNPVLPEVPEMVWGAVAFFGLWLLMKFVLLPPIRQSMRKRDERVVADQEIAERSVVEAEQVRRDYDATLSEARAEAARIIDEARQQADSERAVLIRDAEDEVNAARQSALAELDTARTEALRSLRTQVGAIAVDAASKVIQKPLDLTANQSVVDSYVGSTEA